MASSPLAPVFGFAAILLFLAAPRALAQTAVDATEYQGWQVRSLTVKGLPDSLASELKKGLVLGLSTGLFGKERPSFFTRTLDEDIRRCRLFLARRGYPYASVEAEFNPNDERKRLRIVFHVTPGAVVKVRSVTVTGSPPEVEDEARAAPSVRVGDRFVDRRVADSVDSLRELLQSRGYARARIEPGVKWDDSTRVSVDFRVTPGTAYAFGDVLVKGAPDDLVPLIRRVVPADPGTPYSPEVLADAERNLLVLGLFRQVRVGIEDAAAGTLDVSVEVVMRESRTVEASVRYWTDAQFQGGARWQDRNLFRKGRGGAFTVFSSKFEQLANFSTWWPAVVGSRSRGVVTVGFDNEREDSYEVLSTGVSMSLRYNPTLLTTLRGGVSVEDVDVVEKSDEVGSFDGQEGLLSALLFDAETIDTDDPITPTRGASARLSVEWAPNGSVSEHHFYSVLGTGQAYLPLPVRSVFAVRLSIGVAEPTGSSLELLPNKRFYSGGASSMRGFKRRKLGPLDDSGAALGGEAKLESSAELRFPLFWRFRGTGFVDAGQVWPTVDLVTTTDIEVAVGASIWLETIVGPLRTDYAYRLTDYQESEPRSVWHFSIGPAF